MFSGIVEETGFIQRLVRGRGSIELSIRSNKVARGVRRDDSVSVNGVCLTVTSKNNRAFGVQAVEETLKKTNLSQLHVGDRVNLERALRVDGRVSGHFVMGHVDCVGAVKKVENRKSSKLIWIAYPPKFRKYMIPVGSVSVEGVSLTVATLRKSEFAVSVIPHTLGLTTFGSLIPGSKVNLEFDMIGKYIINLASNG